MTQEIEPPTIPQPTVFFDGVCGLCNAFVDFVMKRDTAGRIFFSPLQGETAKDFVTPDESTSLKSVVFAHGNQTYRKSTAVIRILWMLGGFWKIAAAAMWIIPFPLRNVAYATIATMRYRLFGKRDSCRMPTPAERNRLLP